MLRRRAARGWLPLLLLLSWVSAAAATTATTVTAEPAVRHAQGEGWRLEPRGASGAALALGLARASGSELFSSAEALQGLRPLTRPLQAATLAAAWQALLASSSHALQCDRQRCRVWVLPSPSPAAIPAAIPAAPARSARAAPAPAPVLAAPASTVSVALTPDPPGLFPSE